MNRKETKKNRKKQTVIAVCGVKNSGKTTLIERLLPELAARGIKTAVIKHDGHDFSADVPGTDSDRFAKAGAYGTAVYSAHRMFFQKTDEQTALSARTEYLIAQFPEADLILLEGLKDSAYPKIELVRKEISEKPVSNPQGRFLIVSDLSRKALSEKLFPEELLSEETASFSELGKIVASILHRQQE